MPETLLGPSRIKLYGRVMDDIKLTAATPPAGGGQNHFLLRQLAEADAKLARIYAYSYEGEHYRLASPAVFLVHGAGSDPNVVEPEREQPGGGGGGGGGSPPRLKTGNVARGPNKVDNTGVVNQEWEFAFDVKMWEYDRADFSLRMEVVSGPLEDILLEAEAQGQMASHAGRVQTSGAGRVQVSGAGRVQVSHAGRMQVGHSGGKLE